MYHEAIDISTGSKRLGDAVYAVGYPHKTFNVMAGLWVRRHKADEMPMWDDVYTEWDQSTVVIAPGSSGGALVNAKGELIGMTVGHNGLGGNLDVAISLPVDVIAGPEGPPSAPAEQPRSTLMGFTDIFSAVRRSVTTSASGRKSRP
jgi:S1-C subfamily serine protease